MSDSSTREHTSRKLATSSQKIGKKASIDVISNRFYNTNVAGEHLNFLPIKNQYSYELNNNNNNNNDSATTTSSSSKKSNQGIAELINTYNQLDNSKKAQAPTAPATIIKRPNSVFFQKNSPIETTTTNPPNPPPPPPPTPPLNNNGYSSLSSNNNPYMKLKQLQQQKLNKDLAIGYSETLPTNLNDFLNYTAELNSLYTAKDSETQFKIVKKLSTSIKNPRLVLR